MIGLDIRGLRLLHPALRVCQAKRVTLSGWHHYTFTQVSGIRVRYFFKQRRFGFPSVAWAFSIIYVSYIYICIYIYVYIASIYLILSVLLPFFDFGEAVFIPALEKAHSEATKKRTFRAVKK